MERYAKLLNLDLSGILLTSRQVVAIIDIDCSVLNGFDDRDQSALEELARLLAGSCDF